MCSVLLPTGIPSLPSPADILPAGCSGSADMPWRCRMLPRTIFKEDIHRHHNPASGTHPFGGKAHDARQCVMAVSDVSLSPESFVSRPRTTLHDPSCLRIVFVGTLGSFYKGPDLLVEAVAICKTQGIPARVRFIGSGQEMGTLQKRCIRLGLEEEVEFVGSVTAGEPVRRELDQANLFILRPGRKVFHAQCLRRWLAVFRAWVRPWVEIPNFCTRKILSLLTVLPL